METFCQATNISGEFYPTSVLFRCPFGCSNGACIKAKPYTCNDSDGGFNLYKKGCAEAKDNITYCDQCAIGNASMIDEYYCDNSSELYHAIVPCPPGTSCSDGYCKTLPTCRDTDGGVNYGVFGRVYRNGFLVFSDYCNGTLVTEGYCDTNSTLGIKPPYRCPYGCAYGACSKKTSLLDRLASILSNVIKQFD
jgi:hypothetical protein